jgi:hypothetical protein
MGLYQPRTINPVIQSGYNGSGSTIVKGTIVKLATSSPTYPGQVVKAAGATDPMIGVLMADLPTAQWGDVQTGGVAIVLVGSTVTQGQNITADANGAGVPAASGNAIAGIAQTDGATADYMEVLLGTPGGEANN